MREPPPVNKRLRGMDAKRLRGMDTKRLRGMDAGSCRRYVDAHSGRADTVCGFVFVDQFAHVVAVPFRALCLHREGWNQIECVFQSSEPEFVLKLDVGC